MTFSQAEKCRCMHCMGEFQKTNEQDTARHTNADPFHPSPYLTFLFEILFRIPTFNNYLEGKKNNAEHVQVFYKKQKGTRKVTPWGSTLLSEMHLVHQV